MNQYNHNLIEKKWQRVWKQTGIYRQGLKIKDKKFYVLDMFPYPSGEGLHVGHPKGYIATDVYSRMKKMQGYNILHPMGWDAFGLPAENYAIQNKIHPSVAVKKNIKRFKKQLELLGFNYDWELEINTTDPNYYKWTQWIFLQMFHRGLAYRSDEPINWCPSCKTGLANEDLEDGKCERCGSVVEKRPIPQWVLKITDYADRLLADLGGLNWPEHIKESQRNWIGRSEGINITYEVVGLKESVTVFTTRPDTNFGATFLVAAPDSLFVKNNLPLFLNANKVRGYISEVAQKTELERIAEGNKKTGVFTGMYALNQLNQKRLPIYVGDFVLGNVGTGVLVAVPGHDKRDFEFAKAMGIEIARVVIGLDKDISPITRIEQVQEEAGTMVNSSFLNGMDIHTATKRIMDYLEEKKCGKRVVNYKLRDWVFSRQRYWGEPIPLVFCTTCKTRVENPKSEIRNPKQNQKIKKYKFSKGEMMNPGWIGIPEEKLPVKLPNVKSYEPTGTGESPLAAIESFVHTTCPKCGGPARRETNTMPQWAGSCWYYLAYIMRGNPKSEIRNPKQIQNFKFQKSKRALQKWLPVDMYVGGAEHATRHLIYARFWHKFLKDIDVVDTEEPFARLQNVGLILASDGRKMSKRYGNVVNPDEVVKTFGADSLRVYEMFMGPFNQAIAWSTDSLVGARRFLEKVWRLRGRITNQESRIKNRNEKIKSNSSDKLPATSYQLQTILHRTVKKVGEDIEAMRFNTAVSSMMILVNEMEKVPVVSFEQYKILLRLLAPFAPHITEELWTSLGGKKSIHLEPWPAYDDSLADSETVTLVVQVNGKVRANFSVERDISEDEARGRVLALPEVIKWIDGKEIKKVIYIKGRIINLVV